MNSSSTAGSLEEKLSIASLQNNIGVLMLHAGSIEEAMERFLLAVDAASLSEEEEIITKGIAYSTYSFVERGKSNRYVHDTCPSSQDPDSHGNIHSNSMHDIMNHPSDLQSHMSSESNELMLTMLSRFDVSFKLDRHRVVSYDGLAWFYLRLCRQQSGGVDVSFETIHTTVPSNTNVIGGSRSNIHSNHSNNIKRRGSADLHVSSTQHRNKNSSIDHQTKIPLGLEYILEPLLVGHRREDARIAAYLNLAYVCLMHQGSLDPSKEYVCDRDDPFDYKIIERILNKAIRWMNHESRSTHAIRIENSICQLMVISHINMGVIKFSLGHLKEAMSEFEIAFGYVTSNKHVGKTTVLPQEYLHIATLCNLARMYIRANDIRRSSNIFEQMEKASFPSVSSMGPWSIPVGLLARLLHRCKWMVHTVCKFYFQGLIQHRQEHFSSALDNMNSFLSSCRKEFGHSHPHVAVVLERKGSILFDQRNLHSAMLAYLASLRIYESYIRTHTLPETSGGERTREGSCSQYFQNDLAKLLYSIGRTLHDREEYTDALSMYNRALTMQYQIASEYKVKLTEKEGTGRFVSVDVITTLCNIGRIHHILGELDKAIRVNTEVVELAIHMVTKDATLCDQDNNIMPESHGFVRNRMISLGNLFVEAGRFNDAMTIYTRIARSQGLSSMLSFQPEGSDIDSSAFAVRAAERMGKVGVQHSHASAA